MRSERNPWMKFYPADWRADAMLRLCSIAARGLWTEMMCLMHEAEPYGSLLVNGKRIDKRQLAGLAGISEKDCSALLIELEGNGVFSRDEDGTIYSRRMRRDFEKAVRDKANGRGGGNPRLKGGVNPHDNGEDKAQKPEARSQKLEKEDDAPSGATTTPRTYAFEDGIIRLSERDFEAWRKAYSNLDLPAELLSLSKWADSEGKNWFHALKGALAKRNREVKAAKERAAQQQPGSFKWNGMEGVI